MFIPMWLIIVGVLLLFYPTLVRFMYVAKLEWTWAWTSLLMAGFGSGLVVAIFWLFFHSKPSWAFFGLFVLCCLQPQIDRHFFDLLTDEIQEQCRRADAR